MKAIRVHQTGGPEVMRLEDVPDPIPGKGQVIVRIHAAGVNPVDTYIRAGSFYIPELPYTPGMDGAGTVEAVGEDVARLKPGDRVYTARTLSGSYAELALCAEHQAQPLPENVSFKQGAGVYVPYATAYRALFQKANALAGETVLIHGGSGGVGTAAIQLAKAAGMTIIATAGTDAGRNLVSQLGAHHVLDHHAPDFVEQTMAATNGNGAGVILEMLANVNLEKDLQLAAHGARIVVIGNRGTIEINPRAIMGKEIVVTGMLLLNVSVGDLAHIHPALYAGLGNGTLNPIVGKEFPLGEAPRAHETVMQPGAYGKIVLVP